MPHRDPVSSPTGPPIERRCEGCGATFGCGVESVACWCASVALDPGRRAELAGRFGDCLCPACLTALPASADSRFREPSRGG